MNAALSTYGGPSYFFASSGHPSGPDYRGGVFRDLLRMALRKLEGIRPLVGIAPLAAQWDCLNGSARLEAFEEQMDVIERLRTAPTNWSSAAAEAPSAEQVHAAQRGLISLFLAGLPAPRVMLVSDGTLGAYWRRGDVYASIDFDADGEFPWTAATGNEFWSGTWTGGLPPARLRNAIGA
jgi:AcrR family transcriptional regulator